MSNRLFIDVREPSEYAKDHVEGAINIPLSELINSAKALEGIDKRAELVLYCRSGRRSGLPVEYLKRIGFSNVKNGINKEHIKRTYGV